MKTLLLIDDENEVRESLSLFINRHCGIQVLQAATGKQAIDSYKAHKPDCVFLDLGLPDMDGLKVLQEIRAQDPQAKVYIVTGNDNHKVEDQAYSLGALKCVYKPVQLAEVAEIAKNI